MTALPEPTRPDPSEPLPGRSPVWLTVLAYLSVGIGVLFWAFAVLNVRP